MSNKFIAAAIQIDSQADKQENLRVDSELVVETAGRGAKLIAPPENMNYIGPDYMQSAEPIPGPTSEFLCSLQRSTEPGFTAEALRYRRRMHTQQHHHGDWPLQAV